MSSAVSDDIIRGRVSAVGVTYDDIGGESSDHLKTLYSGELSTAFLIPASVVEPRTDELEWRLRAISFFLRSMEVIKEDD